jgi:hemoglobin/transferrin/lactoferrin receptor protein
MKHIKYTALVLLITLSQISYSQINIPDTSQMKKVTLNEVVISVNKIVESQRTVAQHVQVLTAKEIANSQSQSTADLLSNTAGIFVQKSQLGGGSPVIRGFEASRIVLVIDGVRMNNIIYRAGHLQNVVTIDNNILERTEILFGPSSTIYGSDALGGVVHFYTRQPQLAPADKKINLAVNFLSRYGSADNELTNHLDFNIGGRKFASLTSFTFSRFDDLKGGKNQNPFYTTSYGERPYYVERINGQDSLVKNSDRYLQVQSGYSQYDILQKFLIQQNEHLSHGINLQFSNSTDVPRYDRLTDPKGSGLNYAQWYYGPQRRLLTAYDLNLKNPDSKFQSIHFGVNYQNIEESRHTRKFNNDNLTHRTENVNVIGLNLDFQKVIRSNNIRFGFDGQFNTLKSTANSEDIVTGASSPLDTRYPDGDNTMLFSALYISHTWEINEKLILTDGLRVGFSMLHSTFVDTSFYHFPFTEDTQNNPVYSGSIGIINNPSDDWKLSLLLSTGYRVPNVDDLSKVFESAPGMVIVPNPDLKPEQTVTGELGVTKIFSQKTRWENSIYYTQFFDAIVTEDFTFNGQDSIIYDGEMSQVMANQNKEKAYIYGFSSGITSQCNENFFLSFMVNYTYGRIKTDTSDYPLDHIPPFLARLQLTYTVKNFSADFFVNYNSWKKLKNYNLNGEDNEQYATPDGMPAWFTANFRASYQVYKMITLQAGVDNIFDTQYRTFASGINAPGRNIFAAVKFHF